MVQRCLCPVMMSFEVLAGTKARIWYSKWCTTKPRFDPWFFKRCAFNVAHQATWPCMAGGAVQLVLIYALISALPLLEYPVWKLFHAIRASGQRHLHEIMPANPHRVSAWSMLFRRKPPRLSHTHLAIFELFDPPTLAQWNENKLAT